jgi:creatinine amidohydrolase/Fe(II)-dependent formamide hydrolase-like protein
MAGRTLHYADLNAQELAGLDPDRTIALMALSPLEVHGPHLPIATDAILAGELQARLLARLEQRYADYDRLVLPTFYAGADTMPVPGSIDVDSRAIYHLLVSTGRALAGQGFRYLVVTDNHGGPRHQIAIEKAVRQVYRRHRFFIVAPFLNFFRRMVELDPALLRDTGTGPGSAGDITDAHAGRNETSLMLATAPEQVAPGRESLGWVTIGQRSLVYRLVMAARPLLRRLGARDLAADLPVLALALGSVTARNKPTYIGEPRLATAEAGHRMLAAHVEEALAQLERAMRGQPPYSRPLLWSLRFIEGSERRWP